MPLSKRRIYTKIQSHDFFHYKTVNGVQTSLRLLCKSQERCCAKIKRMALRSGTEVCGGVRCDVIGIIPRKACVVSHSTW